MRRLLLLLPVLLLSGFLSASATADQKANRSISGAGTIGYLGLGLLLPLAQDGSEGFVHSARELDSLLVSGGLAVGLQDVTHIRRPNGSGHDAFPSGHATVAFAMATMQSQFHPWEAPLWYAGATVIAISRVQLHEHTWGEVAAGAVLGFATARIELSSHRGLLLYPVMNDDGGFGAEMAIRF